VLPLSTREEPVLLIPSDEINTPDESLMCENQKGVGSYRKGVLDQNRPPKRGCLDQNPIEKGRPRSKSLSKGGSSIKIAIERGVLDQNRHRKGVSSIKIALDRGGPRSKSLPSIPDEKSAPS